MTNTSPPLSNPSSASPKTLLDGLYAQLRPAPIWSILPSTLNIFAHLQLVASRLRSEAQRALDDNAALLEGLEDDEIPEEEWVGRGALNARQGKRLEGWAEEGVVLYREEEMMNLSFEFRLFHMALLLTNSNRIPIEQSRKLLNTYFPSITPAYTRNSHYCYIRAMSEEQTAQMGLYWDKVEGMYEKIARAEQNGEARLALRDLIPSAKPNHSQQLVQKILDLAEAVVVDSLKFEAMFPPEGGGDRDSVVSTVEWNDPSTASQVRPSRSSAVPTDSTPAGPTSPAGPSTSRLRLPSATIHSPPTRPIASTSPRMSPPPIRAWHMCRAPISPSKSLDSRRSLGTPVRPAINRTPRAPVPTAPRNGSLISAKKRHLDSPTTDNIPDYTSPLRSPNTDKTSFKPFPNSALIRPGQQKKRSRLSETHRPEDDDLQGGGKRARTGVEGDTSLGDVSL